MPYGPQTQVDRMLAVRNNSNGGKFQLVGAANLVMHEVPLDVVSGAVSQSAVLTYSGFPKSAFAAAASTPAAPVLSARVRNSTDTADVAFGLTVGLTSTVAPLRAPSTFYSAGRTVTNGANQYRVATPGTSSAGAGPTGQTAGITDGTVVWDYICPANATVQLSSLTWASGEELTVLSGPTLTHSAL